jgi:hypothetical protein
MAARRGPASRLLNCTDGRLVVGSELLDNSSTHKTPAIRTWLLRHPRFHFHFTPTSSG